MTLSERISYVDNNSVFFVPNPQSRALLSLSVVQPLLRGAGSGYNEAILEIARIDSEAAQEEFVRQASFHLMEVTRAYWNLYLTRVGYLQDLRLVEATRQLVDRAEARAGWTPPARCCCGPARRSTSGSQQPHPHQGRDPQRRGPREGPRERPGPPPREPGGRPLGPAHRLPAAGPDRRRRRERAHAPARGQRGLPAVARRGGPLGHRQNETLPQLDAIAEVATAGLREGGETGEAVSDQFDSDLSFTLGLRFETPIGKSERDARELRRRLELRSQGNQVKVVIETVLLEVKVSVREVETAYRDLVSKHGTLVASREDTRILQERWDGGVGNDGGARRGDVPEPPARRPGAAERRRAGLRRGPGDLRRRPGEPGAGAGHAAGVPRRGGPGGRRGRRRPAGAAAAPSRSPLADRSVPGAAAPTRW